MTWRGRTLPVILRLSSKTGAGTLVGRVRPVLTVVPGVSDADDAHGGGSSLIDELVREGARRMLAEALQAEVDAYIARFTAERDENGRRLVVRNGSHRAREVLTSAGAVEVVAPRVNDRRVDLETGERARFCSVILPAWCRKTPKVTEVLPLLYLHGLSSGDFVPALGQFLGSSAGLSASVITKLTETWKAEQRAFAARDLSGVDYVYLWVDGIHINIRLEEHIAVASRRSGTPRTSSTPSTPSPRSRTSTERSSAKRSRRSPTTSRCCWRSTTTRQSTGFTCAPRTRSSRPSRPCGNARR